MHWLLNEIWVLIIYGNTGWNSTSWDCGRFFLLSFFVVTSSLECLYYILQLKITVPGIFSQSVFCMFDQEIATWFDRSTNLRAGGILTCYPVLQFGKAPVGFSHKRREKRIKGERKCWEDLQQFFSPDVKTSSAPGSGFFGGKVTSWL